MVSIPNIYTSKNLKFFIAIPVFLMFIGIYLSLHLTLDTSLSGGVSVILQTNQSVSPTQLASNLGARLGIAPPTVQQSPGGVQITIQNNQSLANAEDSLLNFYIYRANYSAYGLNETQITSQLQNSPNNKTLQAALAAANAGLNKSLAGMDQQIAAEIRYLSPLVTAPAYNSSNIDDMSNVAQNAYVNASLVYRQKILTALHSVVGFTTYTYQQITPTLSRYFLNQLEGIIIAAFILIFLAVLAIFRSWVPSITILFGAGNDMLIALGAMVLLNIPLGIASLGGLLMLIGYAIDTEMLTAIRIIKRKEGTPEERAYGAMKTGLTMTTAAIASFAVLFVVSLITYVPTYYEISGVVLFGLIGDILTTWFGNAPMLLLYKKSRERV